jgi:hypothetical protein
LADPAAARKDRGVTDQKSPLEQALDLFVFAPIGLALTAREELPKLVEKGRERVGNQMSMAKAMGEFTVTQGQREAKKAVRHYAERYGVGGPPSSGSSSGSDSPEPVVASAPGPAPAAASPAPAPAASTNGGGVPAVDDLAIPGYDSLSASQVVQRLAGLSGEELEAVARYESATRHRKTILTRISQLQTA